MTAISEHAITYTLARCADGAGHAIGVSYREDLASRGWITKDGDITEEGKAELARRARR
jgi:hypothetical protein